MRNLIAFVLKNQFFFLFLLLEVIAFSLLYNNNYYQRSSLISTTGSVNGRIERTFDKISDYFGLRKENQILAKENAMLRALLKISPKASTAAMTGYPVDSSYQYISAKIIDISTNKRNNYFMIDKGYIEGVRGEMGVIAPNGVVGIITNVTDHFSSGMTVLHKDTKVSARVKKNNQLVSVSWKGGSYRIGTLEDIPTHVDLQEGDTVITSGNSHIFPEGIMIGVIRNVGMEEDQLFKTATLTYSTDYNSVNYVYVIRSMRTDQIRQLKNTGPND
jgi:rod shape-determining protein MreC